MKWKLYLVIAGVIIAAMIGVYFKGYSAAKNKYQMEQLKQNQEVRKTYDRIKRKAPSDSDKSAAVKWLRERTR